MDPRLLALIASQLPGVIAMFRELFKRNNPGVPDPTNDEVAAAFGAAVQESLKKGDDWLKAHPQN